MSKSTALCCAAIAFLASPSWSQIFTPAVTASIRDTNNDGQGDAFNAAPFDGLLRQVVGLEDRAVQEFSVASLSGALIQNASISGRIYVNNAFDVGPRDFELSLYAGNGAGELSDFQITSVSIGTASYHPPTQSQVVYSFDVTAPLSALIAGGATWIGLKVDCTSTPNYPNILGNTNDSELEVVASACGATSTFCTSGTSTNGCAATINAAGIPDANAGSGFTLTVSNVEGAKQGLIFYGLDNSGFAPLAWGATSSFLCVKSPTQRSTALNSGGTAGACNGTFVFDWNSFVAANPGALGLPFGGGERVYAQAWYRDPPSPKTTQLSNALEFVVCP